MDFSNIPSPPERNSFGPFKISVFKGGPTLNDLKNISLDDVRSFVIDRKIESVCVLILLVTVFLSFSMANDRLDQIRQVEARITALKDKVDPVKTYRLSLARSKEFLSKTPASVQENKFITELTVLARKRGIQISSFTPPQIQKQGFYNKTVVSIACSSSGFQDALLFLNDIEKAPHSLKVESWKARIQGSDRDDRRGGGFALPSGNASIGMDISISTVQLLSAQKE